MTESTIDAFLAGEANAKARIIEEIERRILAFLKNVHEDPRLAFEYGIQAGALDSLRVWINSCSNNQQEVPPNGNQTNPTTPRS